MPRSPLITEGACNLSSIAIKIVRSGARIQGATSKLADAVHTALRSGFSVCFMFRGGSVDVL